MPPFQRVFAYRDAGSMGPTRWYARRTYCTRSPDHTDLPGKLFVVKFCQGGMGAAAMISEVICNELFRAGGLHVLEPVIAEASDTFAAGWNEKIATEPTEEGAKVIPKITSGRYFGTVYVPDPYQGPLTTIEAVEAPEHLVLVWVFDCLVCNIDRKNKGNLILLPQGKKMKLRVVAADHSDCFCGSNAFADGSWRELMQRRGRAEGHLVIEAVQLIGAHGIPAAIQNARLALGNLGAAFDQVPEEWWVRSGIRPEQVEETLWNRLEYLPNLLDTPFWNEIANGGVAHGAQII